jgi:hypothetical protein
MKFRATLELGGKTATGITVPEDVIEALGGSKRPPVRVTIGAYTYRTTVGSMDGLAKIPVSAEHREAAGIRAGDELDVELELDTAPRVVEVPADFAEALDATPEARRFFDGLSNSLKRYWTLNIEGAKTAETRQRRIEGAIAKLREGKSR